MDFEINQNFADLAADEITAYRNAARAAFDAFLGLDTISEEQVEQAEALAAHIEAIDAEVTARTEREAALASRAEALQSRFSQGETEDEDVEEDEDAEEGDEATDEAPVEEAAVEDTPKARSTVVTLSKKVKRPAAPVASRGRVSITAAADVPGFATGSAIDDLSSVTAAVINRMKGFSAPSGNGQSENLQHYGVASFKMDFPKELTIDRGSDEMQVLSHAAKESRLDGNSLVAAGGWCAPSETLYDLCAGETLDGIISVPEVNVARGGIKYTSGPNFSDFYGNANTMFEQTEAQAIAGTTKPCVEVVCPPFTEVRLDAVGLCLKVPILTNAAYPELIQRYVSGTMVAHQHRVNAEVIGRMVTLAGAAKVISGIGSTAADTLGALELIADQKRQQYRLAMNATLEVVVPFWVKGAVRSDLQNRTGQQAPVTDQQISAHFAARNLNVQFAYDWQDLPLVDDGGTAGVDESVSYPATFNALMYPAGTFIKGTSDVINLNAVYDAASLAVNTYTGLFFEQGLLVAQMCYDADLLTIPVCSAGRTGANDLTCTTAGWA